jgi:MFS transporter, LPLT family, lysophospholipid transporter
MNSPTSLSASSVPGSKRNYPLLLLGQFLGAFGDNALLAVIVGQLTYLAQQGTITAGELRSASTVYTTLLFVPYVLLAPVAGYLNDRYSKTHWLAGGNLLKLCGALICAAGAGTTVWPGVGYLLVGVGACFYGPAKYGILPEILPREKLVKANGMVELLTLLAILTGAIGGARLSDQFHTHALTAYAVVSAIFAAALLCSLFMQRTAHNEQVVFRNSVVSFGQHVRDLLRSRRLARMLLGTALFWVCGAAMKINFQPWGLQTLGLTNNTEIALLGLWLSIGVMVGSVAAGKLHAVGDLRSTPFYGFALAGMLALLSLVTPAPVWLTPVVHLGALAVPVPVAGILVWSGVAAGLFLIPLNAALQAESDSAKLGKTIAVQNLFDNLGMCLAGAYVFLANATGLSTRGVFLGLGIIVALAMLGFRVRANASSAK